MPIGLPRLVGHGVGLYVQASLVLHGITLFELRLIRFPLPTILGLSFICTEMYWDGGGSP